MNFDDYPLRKALRKWLAIDNGDATRYLSEQSGQSVSHATVYLLVLEGHLPLVVYVPTGMKGKQSDPFLGVRELEGGLWDLLMEGERGKPGRQQIEHDYHNQAQLPSIDVMGIDGAWVERKIRGHVHQCQLEPVKAFSGGYSRPPSALSPGCVLGVRQEALDALLAAMTARGTRDESKRVAAEWEDVTITFTSEHQVEIRVRSPYPQVGTDQSHVVTYGDLGFRNKRQDKPTLAWEKFRELAEAEPHRIKLPPKKPQVRNEREDKPSSWKRETGDKERVAIQQRVREINNGLQDAFKCLGYEIPLEPKPLLHDKEHKRYKPTFSIKRAHSYGSTAPDPTSLE